jgi:1,4-alpha-glucan branching enzyme
MALCFWNLAVKNMRLIILAWEYPPTVKGQLSTYLSTLLNQLISKKVEVTVITCDNVATSQVQEITGVKTVRISNAVQTHISVLTRILTLNQAIVKAAANTYYNFDRKVDVVDIFAWHFIPAAVILKKGLGIPFIYSVDSLEDHRSNYANMLPNMTIKSLETSGFFEASLVRVKSDWMRNEIIRIYDVPFEKIATVSTNPEFGIAELVKQYRSVTRG